MMKKNIYYNNIYILDVYYFNFNSFWLIHKGLTIHLCFKETHSLQTDYVFVQIRNVFLCLLVPRGPPYLTESFTFKGFVSIKDYLFPHHLKGHVFYYSLNH